MMTESDTQFLLSGEAAALSEVNHRLADKPAEQRALWALNHLPGQHILSSSFGAQAAVMLHLTTRIAPDIPVVLVDTGYLFPETYRFVYTPAHTGGRPVNRRTAGIWSSVSARTAWSTR